MVLRKNTTHIYVFLSYPGDIMTQNPIAHNALRNTETQPKTVPMPVNFLCLSVWVWFFSGIGMGGPKKP
jgi:hypothetical protein